MNEIAVFLDLTTNEALAKIEADAKTYEGLYVDMADSKQRKYVKDKAVVINTLLKKLDRARIDKSKDYKLSVEAEAKDIKGRLEAANKPFTILIDGYNEERAKILAEEKRVNDEKLAAIQFERDHEDGLQLDRLFDLESKELVANKIIEQQAQEARDRKIAEDAANLAREEAAQLIVKQQQESEAREAAAKQAAIDAEIRAKQAIVDSEAKAKLEAEEAELRLKQQAEQAERDKQAAIEAVNQHRLDDLQREADALAKREANKAHKKRINNKAMQCFIDGGMPKDCAKQAVILIAKGIIDRIVINY